MRKPNTIKSILYYIFILVIVSVYSCSSKTPSGNEKIISIASSNFTAGSNMKAKGDSTIDLRFQIQNSESVPFTQATIKQGTEQAFLGPNPEKPYFTVRFALPIPPAYSETEVAELLGMDSGIYHHNHSPGFEILPNGDALSIYFSAPRGKSENDTSTTFVQARLRYGAEDWDMPEIFFKTIGGNDQSGLLWNDNGKIWFFGGGRNISDYVPFRMATSTDNGATWTFGIPMIKEPANSYTAQPISNAFRGSDNSIYMAMDGEGAHSFLWRSLDNGISWQDMKGRTGGRHSTIIPLDNNGNLLSIGGKNSDVDGWMPMNFSADWGATWSESKASPFPPLGSVQRPSMIRLASGQLLFVSDSYMHKKKIAPPSEWKYGNNCFVAISKDNGVSWHIKPLPVQIPQRHRLAHPSVGYVTARQGANGVIHILTTATYPSLHYELNEAWIWSDEGDTKPETNGGEIQTYTENYSNGRIRSSWSARICPNGRYLLHGLQEDYYENGSKQHEAVYENGRKTGEEIYWMPDGTKKWSWHRDIKSNTGVWIHYWPNGKKKNESSWNLKPRARDLDRQFYGYVANGNARHWNEQGELTATYKFINGILSVDE